MNAAQGIVVRFVQTIHTIDGQTPSEILDELVPALFDECNVVLVDATGEIRRDLPLNRV